MPRRWCPAAQAGRNGCPDSDNAKLPRVAANTEEQRMVGRLDGKRVIVTDPTEYNGADIVSLFREEGADVFAEQWDLTKPTMADNIVREVGHVDILIANLAYPHKYL